MNHSGVKKYHFTLMQIDLEFWKMAFKQETWKYIES